MMVRVIVSEGTDTVEVFSYTNEHVPAQGDRIVYAGMGMQVVTRTWYVGIDGVTAVRLLVDVE